MASTLILGGARSGKSAYAQAQAEARAQSGAARSLVYIATAEAGDAEMSRRIARHQADRDGRWRTVEAPYALAETIGRLAESDVALLDCVTLWLSNVMLAERDLAAETARLLEAVQRCPAALFIVSNEVGWGIVPDNALARAFRDEAGQLNQRLARVADRVVLIAAGLPLQLKPQ